MQNPPQSPPSPSPSPPPQMDTIWDWSEFLDFNIDDQLLLPTEQPNQSPPIPTLDEIDLPIIPPLETLNSFSPSPVVNSDNTLKRVRKRDPRMSCSNFLAGRIPCACPELDAKMAAEEEEAGPGKKRVKTGRVVAGSGTTVIRCQVPGCEADISVLKGYHKRHRVCLPCANATSVVLDGESKRYCQQCGKFHILSDFDEGKRSCRRKLERHNNRRRRKPSDSKGSVERESQPVGSAEDDGCDDEAGKDTRCTSIIAAEGVTLLEAEGHNSVLLSTHAQNIQSDSIVSFAASGETQSDEEKEKYTHSPSYCEDKSAFSSVCPTGRISFKLYDWNPAEFPRRLRHQIFQWLSSMPVELEGYIRPGCTILTLFIAMPKFMWVKLSEDPVVCINDLLASPRNMLSGRGTFFVYLNSMMFSVMEDGTSVIKVQVQDQAPKLHYVHPTCFEAGKPLQFVACGSNLLRPKFRFLISFAGKYLTNDVCVPPLCNKIEDVSSALDHQLMKICVPHTELNVFGPGFVEVENEAGLSNFIPILIADKEICSEIKTMQTKFYSPLCSRESQSMGISSSCEVAVSRHKEFSEFILDISWLLKESALENTKCLLTSSQLQRFTCLLSFLIKNESTIILGRVLYCIKIRTNKNLATGIAEADRRLFERTMNHATDVLGQHLEKVNLVLHPENIVLEGNDQSSRDAVLPVIPVSNQDMGVRGNRLDTIVGGLTSGDKSGTVPLLNEDFVTSVRLSKEQPNKSYNRMITNTNKLLTSRPLIFVIASAAVCFGICAVLLHPQKATLIATTIRRCLFDNENS